MTVTVVECVTPPPVPVTVMVRLPSEANRPAFTVIVDVPAPGAAIELGLKLTLTPDAVEADRAIAELKLPVIAVVIVEVLELPLATLIEVGEALMVKLPAITFKVTVVVSVVLPEVPFTVMEYVPGAADAPTLMIMVAVPAPVIEVGLKLTAV